MLQTAGNYALLFSHGILLPSIIMGFLYKIMYVAAQSVLVAVASFTYHLCRGFDVCPTMIPLAIATQLDYFKALSAVPVIGVALTTRFPNLRYAGKNGYAAAYKNVPFSAFTNDLFANNCMFLFLESAVIMVILTMDVSASLYPAMIIICATFLAIIAKALYMRDGRIIFTSKMRIRWVVAGVVQILLSLMFFPATGTYYEWAHNGWHILVFNGWNCFVYGISREPGNVKKEKDKIVL